MTRHVLFIHGGGGGAYEEDAQLVASLRRELGAGYAVRYPRMPDEEAPDYRAWARVIETEIDAMGDGAILVGHSIGASVLIKWLTAEMTPMALAGVFLMATPFWHDHKVWHWSEVELPRDAGSRLPRGLPVHFYHGTLDEVVPVAHLELYAKAIPQASVRALEGSNHQLNDDLSRVARDIEALLERRI